MEKATQSLQILVGFWQTQGPALWTSGVVCHPLRWSAWSQVAISMLLAKSEKCTVGVLPVASVLLELQSLASVIICHENVRSFLGTFATESMTWQNAFQFFQTVFKTWL